MYISGRTVGKEYQITFPEFLDKEDVFPYVCGICGSSSLVEDKKAIIRLKKTLLDFVVRLGIRQFYVPVPNKMGRFAAAYLHSLKELYPSLSVRAVTTERRREEAEQEKAETGFYEQAIEAIIETEEAGYGFHEIVTQQIVLKASHLIYYEGSVHRIANALESTLIPRKLHIVHIGP